MVVRGTEEATAQGTSPARLMAELPMLVASWMGGIPRRRYSSPNSWALMTMPTAWLQNRAQVPRDTATWVENRPIRSTSRPTRLVTGRNRPVPSKIPE